MTVPPPVLIFRPEADALRTALAVGDAGFLPVVAPLFSVEPGTEPCPSGPFDAVLLTSANAAGRLSLDPATPVLTVGRRTAEAARQAGFREVRAASGDRRALAALVRETFPAGARLLAALGEDRHEDWLGELAAAGHAVTLWTAYAARPAERLPDIARAALSGQPRPVALQFSARGVEVFLARADEAGLGEVARAIRHVVMSEEAATPLRAAGATAITVAATPDQPGLIAALQQMTAPLRLDTAPHNDENDTNDGRSADAGESIGVTTSDPNGAAGGRRRSRREPASAPVIEGQILAEPAIESPSEAAAETAPAAEVPPAAVTATEAAAPPAPQIVRRGPGWGGLIVAGLIGGALGASGLGVLQARLGPGLGVLPAWLVAPAASPQAEAIAALQTRLASAETTLAAAAPRASLQALETRATEALEAAKSARSAAETATRSAAAPVATAPAPAASAGVAATAAAAQPAETGLAALAERIGKAETRLAAVETQAKGAAAPNPLAGATARLLLTERLKAALEAGRPFESEVKGLAAAGVAAEALSPLAAAAGTGVATRAALREELRKHRRAISEDNAGAQPATLADKALGALGRVVSVQRIDRKVGDSPAALAARIDQALEAGDIAGAAAAWAKLPEPARRASEGLGAALAARGKAEAALKTISDAAVAALTAR